MEMTMMVTGVKVGNVKVRNTGRAVGSRAVPAVARKLAVGIAGILLSLLVAAAGAAAAEGPAGGPQHPSKRFTIGLRSAVYYTQVTVGGELEVALSDRAAVVLSATVPVAKPAELWWFEQALSGGVRYRLGDTGSWFVGLYGGQYGSQADLRPWAGGAVGYRWALGNRLSLTTEATIGLNPSPHSPVGVFPLSIVAVTLGW